MSLSIIARTSLLLILSNVFMTFAWYAHLKNLADRPWWIAALISWAIALFEYLIQVPRPLPPGCGVLHVPGQDALTRCPR